MSDEQRLETALPDYCPHGVGGHSCPSREECGRRAARVRKQQERIAKGEIGHCGDDECCGPQDFDFAEAIRRDEREQCALAIEAAGRAWSNTLALAAQTGAGIIRARGEQTSGPRPAEEGTNMRAAGEKPASAEGREPCETGRGRVEESPDDPSVGRTQSRVNDGSGRRPNLQQPADPPRERETPADCHFCDSKRHEHLCPVALEDERRQWQYSQNVLSKRVAELERELVSLRGAIAPVLTLSIRGKYIALPVSMRDALRETYYCCSSPSSSTGEKP